MRDFPCSVELTQTARYDLVIHTIPPDTLRRIARDIADHPHKDGDAHEGTVRIRSLAGLDVLFSLFPAGVGLIAVLYHLRPSDPARPTQMILKGLEWLATIRGALGF